MAQRRPPAGPLHLTTRVLVKSLFCVSFDTLPEEGRIVYGIAKLGVAQVIYLVPGKEMKVGRQPDVCSVVMDSPEVPQMISRCHARLVEDEGTLLDLTRSGTFF